MAVGGTSVPGQLFAPVDLSPYLNAGRRADPGRWERATAAALAALPGGAHRFWGIPFDLRSAPPGRSGRGAAAVGIRQQYQVSSHAHAGEPCWLVLGRAAGLPHVATVVLDGEAAEQGEPTYLAFLHMCAVLPSTSGTPVGDGPGAGEASDEYAVPLTRAGEHLANYVLAYADGTEHRVPIRWRFEINDGMGRAGGRAFVARPHILDVPLEFRGPGLAETWGKAQTGVEHTKGPYWLYALRNPHPDRPLTAVRLEATSASAAVALAGLTRFYGQDHPLRHRQLESFRVRWKDGRGSRVEGQDPASTLDPRPSTLGSIPTEIDLGIIARKYAVPAFDPDGWLAGQGISSPLPATVPGEPIRELFLDVMATPDATLQVGPAAVPLRAAYERGAAQSADGSVRVEVLTPEKTWVHVRVEEAGTGRLVPSRVHFRAPDGRYFPPYGHRHEVNDGWFEDYGADLLLHGTPYAYVDGTFQAELPTGEVYVELYKGFEYRPVRQRLSIQPGQRELTLRLERPLDWRQAGWVTADTHVHFLPPQTAWLEGQAEGVNVINLLAIQAGELFANVADITGALSGVSRDETLVWVGSENRQHLLGHISLLGVQGEPVFPLSAGGPGESGIGDPVWTTLAAWADEARQKGGLVVLPHFNIGRPELIADIVLDKSDAVEINPGVNGDARQLREWYAFLNCGYRLPAVGGTDKASAGRPLGGLRTYALLDRERPFSYAAWADAVRAGRTFTTTGPLLDLRVEGHRPGDELRLPAGGGRGRASGRSRENTLHVEARVESVVPVRTLEIVVNGRVVAVERATAGAVRPDGTYCLTLRDAIRVPGSAWIAARCSSHLHGWVGSLSVAAAHTSPVYVVADGAELFSPIAAAYMVTLLDGTLTWLDELAIPASGGPSGPRHTQVRQVFVEARARLQRRLHAHGDAHVH